jgi:ADP-ribose pyrophosphatase YjhB (NUDIX family)
MNPKWLEWARDLQVVAQNGLHYAKDPYDVKRFETVQQIAAEILAEKFDATAEDIEGRLTLEKGHATPKVDVRGVVFRDGRVLLVKESKDGGWTLPGGWADAGEVPSQAVEREVREESGFATRAVRLLALYDRDLQAPFPPYPFRIYKAFFLCEIVGGEATPSSETDEVAFFAETQASGLRLSAGRTTHRQLDQFFRMSRTGDWTPLFD